MNLRDHQPKNTPPKGQGSFGIPPEIKEAAARQEAKKNNSKPEDEKKAEPQEKEYGADHSEAEVEEVKEDNRPEAILEKLGATFNEESFQQLIFKGSYETTIDVIKGRLKGKFRTLTSDEYDMIDEILATEMKDINMTQDGLRTRSSMWVISFGVTELGGKQVAKPIKDKTTDKVDAKATAIARRAVFAAMAPAIVNQLIQKHGAITVAINTIAADPAENLKNS